VARRDPVVVLASASPRRRALLDQLGVSFEPFTVDIPEVRRDREPAEEFVLRLALAKARVGQAGVRRSGAVVIGADTVVVLDGEIMGKPADRETALGMLQRLSGKTHRVLSAVAAVQGDRDAARLSVSRVTFRALSRSECEAYWATGEPADKAGAYGIQGRAAMFVSHLEGSYSGVMGLPLYETAELLAGFAVDVFAPRATETVI